MKKLIITIMLLVAITSPAFARKSTSHVRGHFTKKGTYVQPYYKTAPDQSTYNNWSTQGNMNPYTGKVGTVNPAYAPKIPKARKYRFLY